MTYLSRVRAWALPLLPGLLLSVMVGAAAGFLGMHYDAPVMLFALLLGIDERQPSWPVPTTTLAGGSGRKTGMPVWRAAPPA